MIPYLGCDGARDMLEPFVDAELPTTDQVILESHLRWCDTCLARLDDLRLIGAAVRRRSTSAIEPDRAAALAAMQSEVVARIDAEHDQSLCVRCREWFTDMRLLWPALGATLALVVCASAVTAVYGVVRAERPHSIAALLSTLALASSDHRLLELHSRLPAPPALRKAPALDPAPEGEAVFLLSAVVTGAGRVATYELLQSAREPAAEMRALVDALKYARLAPAQNAGRRVVNIVWLLARTTVKGSLTGAAAPPVLRPARS